MSYKFKKVINLKLLTHNSKLLTPDVETLRFLASLLLTPNSSLVL
jgi:hypothetical protein